MLSTRTTRTIGVDTDFIVFDFNVDVFIDVWHDITGYKRRLSFSRCIKWRDTHQAMYAFFGF